MTNPAEIASQRALEQLYSALNSKQSFRLEAGAGAGKTYSLIKALKYLIDNDSTSLSKNNQQIACITYTNVAKEEIISRTDNNPVIFAETIHGFCWGMINGLQKQMRQFIPSISDKWNARIQAIGGLNSQYVSYDLGYPKATEDEITLHHDDVIKIFTHFLLQDKFIKLLKSKFPIILIDEYQDTDKDLADMIISQLIEPEMGILIGFFGDHWQKIYGSKACGLIEASEGKILEIGKNANFRSDRLVVEALGRMRPELPQNESDPTSTGEINVFLTNSWLGTRRSDNHWQGDLPPEVAHNALERVKEQLHDWDLSPEKTKILMLTNNVLAKEQGYAGIANIFKKNNDDYLKLNNHYIKFLVDIIEIVCSHFQERNYGEMFKSLGISTPRLKNQGEKQIWNQDLERLLTIRNEGTIGDVIELLKETGHPRLSAKVEQQESLLSELLLLSTEDREEHQSFVDKITSLKLLQYSEIIELSKYLDDKTPFSTKHGVKGAEFENVLVVCGRGWNNYNWNNFLSWTETGIPRSKEAANERNRNLFYVACSRPKKRLAILFTQEISENAISTLNTWFLSDNVSELPNLNQ